MRIWKLGVPRSMAAVVLSAVLAAGCASQTGTANESALAQPELPDITVYIEALERRVVDRRLDRDSARLRHLRLPPASLSGPGIRKTCPTAG